MLKSFAKRELLYLALLSFGINLCFALQLGNLSSVFKFLGAGNAELPLLWLIPPLTGLIIQPLIGQISDDTVSRFGKRRPYIFGWGIFAAISFLCLPFIASLFGALFLMWIIDCSLNGSAEGLRALTGDIVTKESDRSKAFALQAFSSGLGGVLGTGLPYVMHQFIQKIFPNDVILTGAIPLNLKLSFIVTAIILLISLFFGLRQVKEKVYSHRDLFNKRKKPMTLAKKIRKTFLDLYASFRNMPQRYKQICLIHGMTWSGIFIFWLYFTVTLAQNVYGLPIHASQQHPHATEILQQASLDSALYFSIYQYVSLAYAILLYFISNTGRIALWHAISLFIGGIGLAGIAFTTSSNILFVCFIAIGIMWGSMLVLPYAIAMKVLPKGKLGTYLGIFNISITAPQILCGVLLMPIYTYVFQGHANYLLLTAGVLIIISGVFWWRQEQNVVPQKALTFFADKHTVLESK